MFLKQEADVAGDGIIAQDGVAGLGHVPDAENCQAAKDQEGQGGNRWTDSHAGTELQARVNGEAQQRQG